MNVHPVRLRPFSFAAPLLAVCVLSLPQAVYAQNPGSAGARSVIGANSYLSDGATALMLGNYAKGVELTRMGLAEVLSAEERVASLSNLCAGYVGLKEYEVAIVYCNRSLDINPQNWRALQNRAAAYSGLGDSARALADAEQGLNINPDSDDLKMTLALVREQVRRAARAPTKPRTTS